MIAYMWWAAEKIIVSAEARKKPDHAKSLTSSMILSLPMT
jgi:hypothetical protein